VGSTPTFGTNTIQHKDRTVQKTAPRLSNGGAVFLYIDIDLFLSFKSFSFYFLPSFIAFTDCCSFCSFYNNKSL
jgi:hypothetical protein